MFNHAEMSLCKSLQHLKATSQVKAQLEAFLRFPRYICVCYLTRNSVWLPSKFPALIVLLT